MTRETWAALHSPSSPSCPVTTSTSSWVPSRLTKPRLTQAQTRHQQHKPARRSGVLLGCWESKGLPRGLLGATGGGSSPSQGSRGDKGSDCLTPLDHCPDPGPLLLTCPCRGACRLHRGKPCKAVVLYQELSIISCRAQHSRVRSWEEQDQICEEPPRGSANTLP